MLRHLKTLCAGADIKEGIFIHYPKIACPIKGHVYGDLRRIPLGSKVLPFRMLEPPDTAVGSCPHYAVMVLPKGHDATGRGSIAGVICQSSIFQETETTKTVADPKTAGWRGEHTSNIRGNEFRT